MTYKAFPSFEKLATSIHHQQSTPVFQHGSQFPVLMTHAMIERMEKFTFVLEVWD